VRFQKEIAEMIAHLKGDPSISERESDVIELGDKGALAFSNDSARLAFHNFINNGAATLEEMFK
jgi:hypothetical protein